MKIFKNRNRDKDKDKEREKNLDKTDRLAELLSFPQGTFVDFPVIQVRGNREITINGCMGLLSYSHENILLETKYCRISINGRALTLSNLAENILAVRGFIQNVEFTL